MSDILDGKLQYLSSHNEVDNIDLNAIEINGDKYEKFIEVVIARKLKRSIAIKMGLCGILNIDENNDQDGYEIFHESNPDRVYWLPSHVFEGRFKKFNQI